MHAKRRQCRATPCSRDILGRICAGQLSLPARRIELRTYKLRQHVAPTDAKKHTHQSISDTKLVCVVVDMITDSEVRRLELGEPMSSIKTERIARILQQTFHQGGVASLTDVAVAA